MALLEVQNIHHQFDTLEVLRGVNLTIEKGEIVSIIGKSGAGKTTLLQIMGSLLRPTSGKVLYNGTDISSLKERELAAFRNQHIGFIFQFHQLLPEFTALENVLMPAWISGKAEEAKQRAIQLLTDLGLQERMNHKPSELSGGEKQRVAAARALMMKPDVILADEPTGSLDSQNKAEMSQLLLTLRKTYNQTIVIVTHDRELARISDRVIEMRDGTIVNSET